MAKDLPVHPLLAIIPECEPWLIEDMADSIEAHGLSHPVVVQDIDGVRTLIDGRARLRACQLAGVEPTFNVLPADTDPRDAIFRLNILRQHLNASQQAMHATMHGMESRCPGLQEARVVVERNSTAVEPILWGVVRLVDAYAEVQRRDEQTRRNKERLVSLPAVMQASVKAGEIELDDAMVAAGLEESQAGEDSCPRPKEAQPQGRLNEDGPEGAGPPTPPGSSLAGRAGRHRHLRSL